MTPPVTQRINGASKMSHGENRCADLWTELYKLLVTLSHYLLPDQSSYHAPEACSPACDCIFLGGRLICFTASALPLLQPSDLQSQHHTSADHAKNPSRPHHDMVPSSSSISRPYSPSGVAESIVSYLTTLTFSSRGSY